MLGRNVRSLRFLAVIFAEERALTPHVRVYQRLLARDEDEATSLVERKRQELGDVGVIHELLLPALMLVSQHRALGSVLWVRLQPDSAGSAEIGPTGASQPSGFCGSPFFSQLNTTLCQTMRCT